MCCEGRPATIQAPEGGQSLLHAQSPDTKTPRLEKPCPHCPAPTSTRTKSALARLARVKVPQSTRATPSSRLYSLVPSHTAGNTAMSCSVQV